MTAAQELQEQHRILGIPPEQLSAPAHKTLRVLAASAAALQLRTCSPAAFLMALSDLKLQQSSIVTRQADMGTATRWLQTRQDIALQRLDELQTVLASVKEQAAASQLQQIEHSEGAAALRQEEYELRGQVQALEEQLSRAGYKPEIRHDALMQRQQDHNELKAEVARKEALLAQYRDLPPNLAAAKQTYQIKLQRLQKAREDLEDQIALL
eukprot:jgi/Astpho2/9826/Aster-x0872